MKKSEWAFVTLLVVAGVSCLLMAGGGYAWVVEGGWRGVIAQCLMAFMPYLMVLVCIGMLIAIGGYVLSFLRVPARSLCPSCKRTVEENWRRCPYCETHLGNVQGKDEAPVGRD